MKIDEKRTMKEKERKMRRESFTFFLFLSIFLSLIYIVYLCSFIYKTILRITINIQYILHIIYNFEETFCSVYKLELNASKEYLCTYLPYL